MSTDVHGVAIRHLNLFRERLSTLSDIDQFKKIATMFLGASYRLGSENFVECDCSGLICSSLSGMGYSIRINADDIIMNCCTPVPAGQGNIIGFLDRDKEKYTHIAIIFHSPSGKTLLHSSWPIGVAFEDWYTCVNRYQKKGYRINYFDLDFDKVKKMDGKVYGIDEDFN